MLIFFFCPSVIYYFNWLAVKVFESQQRLDRLPVTIKKKWLYYIFIGLLNCEVLKLYKKLY